MCMEQCEPMKEPLPEVSTQIDRLNLVVSQIIDEMGKHNERLAPILKAEPEVPLAMVVSREADRLDRVLGDMQSLRQRVEL